MEWLQCTCHELDRRLLSRQVMTRGNSRNERRFKISVNHRKLEPMLVDADRRRRKPGGKKAQPPRPSWDRSRQDD
jgi:hypothetical protein